MADYANFSLDQGSTFNYTLVLNDDATGANINISSYTLTSQMRKSYYSANITANLVCTLYDSNNGAFNVSLDAANTAVLKPQRYVFDVMCDTGNTVFRVIEGTIIVNPGVTR